LAVLDIIPTYTVYQNVNKTLATAYYHWFFLIQPAPLPETLISSNAEFYLNSMLGLGKLKPHAITPEAFTEYLAVSEIRNGSRDLRRLPRRRHD
jgi:haloacetate dehalogenase